MNTAPLFVEIQRLLGDGKYALASTTISNLEAHPARCLAATACTMVHDLLSQMPDDERRDRLNAWGLYAAMTHEVDG